MALGEARQSWEQTEQECLEKVEVSLEGKNTIDALMWDISRRAGSHRGALCSLLVVTWSEWVRAVCRLLKGVGVRVLKAAQCRWHKSVQIKLFISAETAAPFSGVL